MNRWIPISIFAVLIAVGAIVHGSTTHRWSTFSQSANKAESVHALSLRLGEFEAKVMPSDLPVKERSSVTCRQYISPGREGVVVSITSGPPGAVSTHTPDVCYPGSGYKTAKAPKVETIDLPNGKKAKYLVADYEKKSETSVERQRIRWSWTADGTWNVPDQPRFAYIQSSTLYKLYFVTSVPPGDTSDGDSQAVREMLAQAFVQYSAAIQGK